jgi:hypothetical protein
MTAGQRAMAVAKLDAFDGIGVLSAQDLHNLGPVFHRSVHVVRLCITGHAAQVPSEAVTSTDARPWPASLSNNGVGMLEIDRMRGTWWGPCAESIMSHFLTAHRCSPHPDSASQSPNALFDTGYSSASGRLKTASRKALGEKPRCSALLLQLIISQPSAPSSPTKLMMSTEDAS